MRESTSIPRTQTLTVLPVLQDPSVAASPVESRIAFLQSKNLTQEEVDAALARADGQAAAPSYANYAPQQQVARQPPPGYGGGYQQPWQPQAPPELPKRDWRDWFIMATVAGGVSYGLYTVAKVILPNTLKQRRSLTTTALRPPADCPSYPPPTRARQSLYRRLVRASFHPPRTTFQRHRGPQIRRGGAHHAPRRRPRRCRIRHQRAQDLRAPPRRRVPPHHRRGPRPQGSHPQGHGRPEGEHRRPPRRAQRRAQESQEANGSAHGPRLAYTLDLRCRPIRPRFYYPFQHYPRPFRTTIQWHVIPGCACI